MRLYSFGGTTLPITDVTADMPIERRRALINLPDGAFDQDGADGIGQSAVIQQRMTIYSETSSAVDTSVNTLIAALAKGRRVLKSVLRDGTTYWQTFAKLRDVRRSANVDMYDCQQTLDVSWDQDYPFWLASADEPYYLDDGHVFDDGWTFDSGQNEHRALTTTSDSFTITNDGGAAFVRGTLIIVPQTGASFTDITVKNLSTDHKIVFTGTLTAGDRLDIDFLAKAALLNFATDEYANIATYSGQYDWMQLALGDNDIEITLTSITGTVDFYWYWSAHYL